MTDKKEGRNLAPHEKAFLLGLADLAQKNHLTPRQTLPLFGHLARVAAHSEHFRGKVPLEEALADAVALFLAGAGVTETEVELELAPSTTRNKDLH